MSWETIVGLPLCLNFFRLYKKYYIYTIALISLCIVFQYCTDFFLTNKKIDLQLTTTTEASSYSSISMVYQSWTNLSTENCNYSYFQACKKHSCPPGNSVHKNEFVNLITLVLRTRSLMYCAVPKVATKTLLTLMVYMHVRDIIENFNNNWRNIDAARAQMERSIDISTFIEDLRQV